jgi:hypothetical protein
MSECEKVREMWNWGEKSAITTRLVYSWSQVHKNVAHEA